MRLKRCLLTFFAFLICIVFLTLVLLTRWDDENEEFEEFRHHFRKGGKERRVRKAKLSKADWRKIERELGQFRENFDKKTFDTNEEEEEYIEKFDHPRKLPFENLVYQELPKLEHKLKRNQIEKLEMKNAPHVKNLDLTSTSTSSGNRNQATIVTALLDIGRGNWSQYRRPYTMYQDYMTRLLSLDINLVAFTDTEGAKFIRQHRTERMQKTIIQEITLSQLPLYKHYHKIEAIIDKEQAHWRPDWDSSMRFHPESTSAEYDILMNSKPYFLFYIANWNPFNSNYFYWLDAGYGHGNAMYPPSGSYWAPKNIMTPQIGDKVTFIQLGPVDLKFVKLKDMYRQGATVVNGGFFGGNKRAVGEFFHLHNRVFENLLNEDYADDDQTLTVLCYHEKPELFNMVVGDWYDVFRLFKLV